jgi:hypothetical protein
MGEEILKGITKETEMNRKTKSRTENLINPKKTKTLWSNRNSKRVNKMFKLL